MAEAPGAHPGIIYRRLPPVMEWKSGGSGLSKRKDWRRPGRHKRLWAWTLGNSVREGTGGAQEDEDRLDLMDLAEYAKRQRWWNKVFGQNSGPIAEKYSVATQLAIGGVTGWCAGYLFKKVGKLAASAVGGGFFLLQIANHTGYIKVDWKRVEQDVNKAKKQFKINTEKPPEEAKTKMREYNPYIALNNNYYRLAEMTGRPMRVVGWYHSHPHITVWPSHVDVRTQAMYQMMDQGFVGLIFSCFIEDKNTKTGRILYTCFQSVQAQKGSEYERVEIPIHVVPHETIGKVCLESAVELPKILCQEEQDAYRRIHNLTHLDPVTKIHNGSVFTKNLCSQMSAISGPLLQWLEDRLDQNKQRISELQQEKKRLTQELAELD
ncbi:BRCC3 deubiquitinase, partial [Polypterus senegalus]